MRRVGFITIGLILCLIANSGFAEKKGYIAHTSVPPVIDGIKETTWEEATSNQLINNVNGSIDNSSDLSANWYGLWDDENIYFLAEVTDDLLKNNGPGASKYWIHDCFEIFFDLLNEKNNVSTDVSTDDEKYQYRFIYNLDNEPIYEAPPETGIVNISKATDTGYIIEVKIPWSTLIGTHPFGDLIIGKTIGAEFQVADLDNNPAEWMPDANITWNNPTGENLKVAATFGTLILVKDNKPDNTSPSAITNLSANATGAVCAELSWTSTGDDQMEGLAASYQVRYNTVPVTELNWINSTEVDIQLEPKISGTPQTFIVNGLTGSTTYYFAIVIADEAGNLSPISNSTTTTTLNADIINPSKIEDLFVKVTRPISIEIEWTATGDDGLSGKASKYDIRYSKAQISESNWANAAKANNLPIPTESGNRQSMIIIGLQPLTTYFVGIKAIDDENNESELSNIVSGTTTVLEINSKTSMDQFIGTNAFIDDPIDKMKVAGFIREYHNWSWDEGDIYDGGSVQSYSGYPNNKNAFNPSWAAGGNGWFFDEYYKKLYDAGITVCPAIQGAVRWLNSSNNFGDSNIPVKAGLDREKAESYAEHADHLFQFAARYGSKPVADNLLKLADNQPRKSGLGYLKYLENWNEPDCYWGTADEMFTAENLAAMGSADRDGHLGAMGNTFGVKNADSDMKLVMGGLAVLDINYIEKIRQWCLTNRADKSFVYDVINVHHYCEQKSPEAAGIKELFQSLVDYRDQFLPDVEVWMTEFGWDTGIYDTPFTSHEIGDYSREEVQAQWIIREYLLLSSTGIDRAAQFMLRNSDNDGKTQFASCGFVSEKGTWSPKPSWYYTYTMKNTLAGMYYIGEQASMNPNVLIYKYENTTHDTLVYALWSPTSNETYITDYQLSLLNGTKSAKLVGLTNGSIEGTISDLKISRNTVKVNVSERPIFVVTTTNNGVSSAKFETKRSILLYPTFTNSKLVIETSDLSSIGNMRIQIINQTGAIVYEKESSEKQTIVDVATFSQGVYFAKVKNGSNTEIKKFIKY